MTNTKPSIEQEIKYIEQAIRRLESDRATLLAKIERGEKNE